MGEARRREKAPVGPIEIKGPSSYEIASYRLNDILAGALPMRTVGTAAATTGGTKRSSIGRRRSIAS
jgi:hypothetical protein